MDMSNYDPTAFDPMDSNNEFMNNLRQALQETYDTSIANLENTRKLDHTNIMSTANQKGMLYSNFPQRDKIKYDTYTYMPNQVKIRQAYQTGLDALRQNGVDAANQVKYYQQMIDHYNTLPTSSSSGSNSGTSVDLISEAVKNALGNS